IRKSVLILALRGAAMNFASLARPSLLRRLVKHEIVVTKQRYDVTQQGRTIMKEFHGKVAIVTGGTSGIGRAAAVAYAREGARVVVAGRRAAEGEETVQLLRAQGGDGLFVATDVSKAAQVKELVDRTMQKFGRLDFAFNNAGIEQEPTPFLEQDEETY